MSDDSESFDDFHNHMSWNHDSFGPTHPFLDVILQSVTSDHCEIYSESALSLGTDCRLYDGAIPRSRFNICIDTINLVPAIPGRGVWAHPFYDSLTTEYNIEFCRCC